MPDIKLTVSPSGSALEVTYSYVIEKETGRKVLKPTGKTNIYDKIQSVRAGTSIYEIIERFERGDLTVLNKRSATYGDFTNVPKSITELSELLMESENFWKSLPAEFRKEFMSDYNVYVRSIVDGTFDKVASDFLAKNGKVEAKKEVKKDDSEQ